MGSWRSCAFNCSKSTGLVRKSAAPRSSARDYQPEALRRAGDDRDPAFKPATLGKPIGKAVVGNWEVATAQNVDNTGDRYSQWLGTGGWSDDPADTLLQAGVAGVVDTAGVANYYPWWEWTSQNVPVP